MKSNKKRGFTLVELLVVIAILAILATVSVVGYTSFIERAAVSNDENVASQLNQFLIALKADSNSEYYGKDITPDNAREILNHVLEESGLEELEPQSAQYGYHFYFDLKEGKVVLSRDAINEVSLAMHIIRGFRANALTYNVSDNPATCFTNTDDTFADYNGIRYVFLDTAGSELAELVDLFYGVNTSEDFARLQELASGTLLDGKNIPALNALVNKSIFVGSAGSFMTNSANEKTLFFGTVATEDKYIGNTEVPAFDVPTSGVMNVPSTIKFLTGNSLNFTSNEYVPGNSPYTTVLHFELTLDEVAKTADPSFTNVVFTLADGVQYACVENEIIRVEDGVVVKTIAPKNPLTSFDFVAVDDNNNYIYNNILSDGDNVIYISWDNFVDSNFTLSATKFAGEHDDIYGAVSVGNIVWSVNEASSAYLTLVDASGVFKFTNNIPAISANNTCVVKVDAEDSISGTKETFEICVVRVIDTVINLAGKDVTQQSVNTLVYDSAVNDQKFDISAIGTTFTYGNIIADGQISGGAELAVSFSSGSGLNYSNNKILVDNNTVGAKNVTLTFNLGHYQHSTKDIVLYDAGNLPYQLNTNINGFKVAYGTEELAKLTVGDFFKPNPNSSVPTGGTVKLYVSKGASNSDISTSVTNVPFLETEYVSANNIEIDKTFYFKKSYTSANITLFLVQEFNGEVRRISPNFTLELFGEGANVRSWSDIQSLMSNDGVVSKNIVLMNDIAFADGNKLLTLSSATLYGNDYVIDMTGYKDEGTPTGGKVHLIGRNIDIPIAPTDEALITLNASTLNYVKIIGEVYESKYFYYQTPTQFAYGASLVKANDGSSIDNCYLANTRSPLKITGTVTVKDTTLFGGNYANIDVAPTNDGKKATTLILKGAITTINQSIEGVTEKTVGLGIAVDMLAHKNSEIDLTGVTEFTQYNYISAKDAELLPVVTYTMEFNFILTKVTEDVNVFLKDVLGNCFKSGYDDYIHNGTYLNTGIMFLNGVTFDSNSSLISGALNLIFGNAQADGTKITGRPSTYDATTVQHQTPKKTIFSNYWLQVTATGYLHIPKNSEKGGIDFVINDDPNNPVYANEVPANLLPNNILSK